MTTTTPRLTAQQAHQLDLIITMMHGRCVMAPADNWPGITIGTLNSLHNAGLLDYDGPRTLHMHVTDKGYAAHAEHTNTGSD